MKCALVKAFARAFFDGEGGNSVLAEFLEKRYNKKAIGNRPVAF